MTAPTDDTGEPATTRGWSPAAFVIGHAHRAPTSEQRFGSAPAFVLPTLADVGIHVTSGRRYVTLHTPGEAGPVSLTLTPAQATALASELLVESVLAEET